MDFKHHFTRSGSGLPFVFQHGLGSQVAQPQGLLTDLSNIHLISMDCPGHGQSALSADRPPSFEFYTDLVIELLDLLDVEMAIWGGISMGSGIALNAALRYPDRVSALVLVRPAWLDYPEPENLRILLDAAKLIGKPGGLEAFKQLEAFQKIQAPLPKAAQSVLGVFASTQNKQLPLVLRNMVKDQPFSNLNDLVKIQQPCLIIANDHDPLHPFGFGETIQKIIRGSTLEKVVSRYIDNEAHQQQVQKAVLKFLDGL